MFLPRLVVWLAASLSCDLVPAKPFAFSWYNDAFLGQDQNHNHIEPFTRVCDVP